MLVTAISLATVGCAGAKVQSASCAADPRDSIYAASGPAYRDCAVDTKAKLTNPDVRADFQPPARTACYSAELQFVVGTDGRAELPTARVASTNSPAFGEAVLATLSQWRYDPALRAGVPVRQIVTEKRLAATAVQRVPAGGTTRPPPRPPNC
jgi:hypothetical protein